MPKYKDPTIEKSHQRKFVRYEACYWAGESATVYAVYERSISLKHGGMWYVHDAQERECRPCPGDLVGLMEIRKKVDDLIAAKMSGMEWDFKHEADKLIRKSVGQDLTKEEKARLKYLRQNCVDFWQPITLEDARKELLKGNDKWLPGEKDEQA